MPKIYLFTLLALTTSVAQAQDYRPFRAGLTSQLHEAATPGDTTHTLRLDGGSRVGADSVFRFNTSARRIARSSATCYASHQQRPDNLFGATLTVKGAGTEYVLTAANGRSCTLRPRQALGQAWTAMAPRITAQVTAKVLASVFGQPDSVVTIAFSNGISLRLSKRFGLLEGPSLLSSLDGRYPQRQLTALTAPIAVNPLGPQAIYDYQPGDVFLRHYRTHPDGGSLCTESWQRDSVLTRARSLTGDSLLYTLQTRTLTRGYGTAGAPSGFCNIPAGFTLSPADTWRLAVPPVSSQPEYSLATNEFTNAPAFIWPVLSQGAAHQAGRFNGRLEHAFITRRFCTPITTDSLYLSDVLDRTTWSKYGLGLGMTYRHFWDAFSGDSFAELIGYRKGSETWGQLSSFAQLLPTRAARPAATTAAFPNPFDAELMTGFALTRAQAVRAELHDALGRTVLVLPPAAYAAGQQTLRFPTAALPAGMYTLHLYFPAESRQEVVKVLKAQ
jgi:hypothetical protein